VKSGDTLNGRYRLIAMIGKGSMGVVWHAHHLDLDAPVAIKLMHREGPDNPLRLARFTREAKSAATLRSRHVVQTLDFGIDHGSGMPFIVLELLRGQPLNARIARGPLSVADTLRVVTETGRALVRAHRAGIVHRDLKPENIYLADEDGEQVTKVLDFGIAKWCAQVSTWTENGVLIGTPHYMSPEQMRSPQHVDHRSDLWSLAIITCECMTGHVPFDAENLPGLIFKVCNGEATRPSELGTVPDGFDDWFTRATAARLDGRFQSIEELVEGLQLCLGKGDDGTAALDLREPTHDGEAPDVRSHASNDPTAAVAASVPRHRRSHSERNALTIAAALLLGIAVWLGVGTLDRPRSEPAALAAVLVDEGYALSPGAHGASAAARAVTAVEAPLASAAAVEVTDPSGAPSEVQSEASATEPGSVREGRSVRAPTSTPEPQIPEGSDTAPRPSRLAAARPDSKRHAPRPQPATAPNAHSASAPTHPAPPTGAGSSDPWDVY
jgi:serine/threonine protein kinase